MWVRTQVISANLSKIVGPAGKIIAFEPISRLNEQFMASVEKNNISTVNKGCGEQDSTLRLSINPENIGSSSLINKTEEREHIQVDICVLDSYLKDEAKIDVEGFELEVLHGAVNLLNKHKPKILLEFTPRVYSKSDSKKASNILCLLHDLGYVLFDIDSNQYIKRTEEYLEKDIEQTNIFCSPANV
jgi:FkbM family methyltransferase